MSDRVLAPRASLVALAVAAASAAFSSCSGHAVTSAAPADPIIAVSAATRADIARTLVLTAELRPYEEIDVHSKVAGYLKEVAVDVGDRVTAGQLLAIVEVPELQHEVDQADAGVRLSLSEIQRTKADLERAQAGASVTHLTASRLAAVQKSQPGLVAQQEIDDATGRDRVADAQVATAAAAVASSEQQLQVATANQGRLHSLFDYTRITAPFPGIVTKRYADTGAMIQAGTSSQSQAMPVVRLSRDARLRLVIPIPESAVPNVRLGTPVQIRVGGLGRTLAGSIARVSGQVDVATRTMHAEVDVDNPTRELVPGMYAEVSLVVGESKHALTVPIQALNRGEDRVTVFVVDAHRTVVEQAVTLGVETADRAEVTTGLHEGDLVVVGNRSQLRPGSTVQPKVTTAAPAKGGV
jgi:RND family efflux transporter MFP subunit